MASRRYRAAFTLIELLVIIAIVAILLGLIVAAVQKARESASRAQCTNNLRQLGLALHQHHDSREMFPPGMRYRNGGDPYKMMSWLTQVLPYLEQQELWAISERAYRQSSSPFANPPHVGLATVMGGFACPSDSRAASVQIAARDGFSIALTSYLGVEGKNVYSQDGILFRDSRVGIRDITDGTSQTLLVGERPPSADFQFGWWYAGAGQQFTGSADMVLGVQEQNIVNYGFAPCRRGAYEYGPGQINDQCDMFHFWSVHPGGANFMCADGSVHFLTYSAAPLLPALASRAGGEITGIPD
jgi:hypothetical protein